MDKNLIQEEGILVRYLAGELTREERAKVDRMLRQDAKLQQEFSKLEESFEQMAIENAVEPPSHVKGKLLEVLAKNNASTTVVPWKKGSSRRYQIGIAASLAAVFLLSSAWLYNRWQKSETNLLQTQEQTSALQERVRNLEDRLGTTEKWYNAINQPSVVQLVLEGNQKSPSSKAIAYVNHEDKSVILNRKGLPKLAPDKTYQMWADVDHVMVNMGVIPANVDMVSLEYIENAASLNITIEPAGGNEHPTVEQLISNVLL